MALVHTWQKECLPPILTGQQLGHESVIQKKTLKIHSRDENMRQ